MELLAVNPFVPNATLSLPPDNIRKPGGRERVHWGRIS